MFVSKAAAYPAPYNAPPQGLAPGRDFKISGSYKRSSLSQCDYKKKVLWFHFAVLIYDLIFGFERCERTAPRHSAEWLSAEFINVYEISREY